MNTQCYTCKKAIHRPPSLLTGEKNFCNHKCYAKFKAIKWTDKSNPRYSGGNDKLKCIVCDKPYERQKHGKKQNKYCSIECSAKDRGILQRAERHWNWKGGNSTRYKREHAPRPKPERCEVCNSKGSSFKYGLHYDHNHKTDKFRGWLCTNCNTTLGLVKENPETLQALIKYLNQENSL